VNCNRYRRLMHEMLDGSREMAAELEGHLAECPRCRAVWAQLQTLDAALREEGCPPLDPERREQSLSEAMGRIRLLPAPVAPAYLWAGRLAKAAVLVAVFGLGLLAGRALWPREVAVTRIIRVPQVRERVVRVEVPVVEERVVVKRVPVPRRRARRATAPQPAAPAAPAQEREPEVPLVHYDGGAVPLTQLRAAFYPDTSLPPGAPDEDGPGDGGSPDRAGPPPIMYGVAPDFEEVALASPKGRTPPPDGGNGAWQ
jgi:hypothetical protein